MHTVWDGYPTHFDLLHLGPDHRTFALYLTDHCSVKVKVMTAAIVIKNVIFELWLFVYVVPGADPDRCNRSICYGQIFQR